MIVKQLSDIIGSQHDIDTPNWRSYRLLLKKDNLGFSLHHTIIKKGTETYIWYKNHLEAVYCIKGVGEIEFIATGEIFPIKEGTLYALDKHDEHYLRATTDMHMVCVFNPPLVGDEIHDENGVYPLKD
ncbi:MAG: ectoine synthase [Syntrophomonadaceae bacterium]|nr:ectoine synthase [Syntrophomonadaceae bacterium]